MSKRTPYRQAADRYLIGVSREIVESWVMAFLAMILAGSFLEKIVSNWTTLNWAERIQLIFTVVLAIGVFLQSRTLRRFKSQLVSRIGIRRIDLGNEVPDIRDYDIAENENFYFLGISAKHFVYDEPFRAKLVKIGHNRCQIRFLLLKPDGEHISRRAQDEAQPVEEWRRHVEDSVRELLLLGKSKGINIEVRLYDCYPIWRLISGRNGCMYVSYFLHGKRGRDSPHLLLANDQIDDLHCAYHKQFEELWRNGAIDATKWLESKPRN